MRPQPHPTPDSLREMAKDALIRLGPFVAIGGLLAILRTRQWNWFYAAFIPVGLTVFACGLWMLRKDKRGS